LDYFWNTSTQKERKDRGERGGGGENAACAHNKKKKKRTLNCLNNKENDHPGKKQVCTEKGKEKKRGDKHEL